VENETMATTAMVNNPIDAPMRPWRKAANKSGATGRNSNGKSACRNTTAVTTPTISA
jgi:hypothetical protein